MYYNHHNEAILTSTNNLHVHVCFEAEIRNRNRISLNYFYKHSLSEALTFTPIYHHTKALPDIGIKHGSAFKSAGSNCQRPFQNLPRDPANISVLKTMLSILLQIHVFNKIFSKISILLANSCIQQNIHYNLG